MSDLNYDLIVIGAGPGGYVAAIRANQLGLKTAVIEKEAPGGVCLNWGCIPSKSLISQAKKYSYIGDLRKMGIKFDLSEFNYANVYKKSRIVAMKLSKGVEFLLKKNEIELIKGTAKITGPNMVTVDNDKMYSAKFILVATGSRPKVIKGFEFDEKDILSSTGALSLEQLPKSILILGAGAIGVEFAFILNTFGVEVHLVEMMDQILPLEDTETAEVVAKSFKRKKIRMYTSTLAERYDKSDNGYTVFLKQGKSESNIAVEKILVAVGRTPNSENLGLEKLGIENEKGFIRVGDYYQTGIPSVYAIGDVINTPLLAHVASKEGEIAVEYMAGHQPEPKVDPMLIPGATYCEPQVASFGLTEQKAIEQGISFGKYVFPYRGVGKSVAVEESDGIVKILYKTDTKEILGAHIAGKDATELIHEILLAKKAKLLPEDIATMIHAHPTLAEAVMEAARGVEGWAIHV
ncbi:MAG: dihydrolipoyl dehydrogenase [Candidatus Marinimicrobia bacterium]|nr:dihydrolipoyl dehydrogenase [bacterium]MCG2716837.1 dihydrolipoyl dehydrogenase [Candidatus Neomarinimicrobiota bacterium]